MASNEQTERLDFVRRAIPRLRRLGYAALADQNAADDLLLAMLADARQMTSLAVSPPVSRSLDLYRLYADTLERNAVHSINVHVIRRHVRPRTQNAIAARLWALSPLERMPVILTCLEGFSLAQTVYILQRPVGVVEAALASALAALDPDAFTNDPPSPRASSEA